MKTFFKATLALILMASLAPSVSQAQSPRRGHLTGGQMPTRSANHPDLIVQEFVRIGAVVRQGGSYRIPFRLKVKNNGGVATGSQFANAIQSANQAKLLWSQWSGNLGAGATKTFEGVIQMPDNGLHLSGRKWVFIASADAHVSGGDTSGSSDWVQEANEFNNRAWLTVRVEGELDLTSEPASPGHHRPGGVVGQRPQRPSALPLPPRPIGPGVRPTYPSARPSVPMVRPVYPQRPVGVSRPSRPTTPNGAAVSGPSKRPGTKPVRPTNRPTRRPSRPTSARR